MLYPRFASLRSLGLSPSFNSSRAALAAMLEPSGTRSLGVFLCLLLLRARSVSVRVAVWQPCQNAILKYQGGALCHNARLPHGIGLASLWQGGWALCQRRWQPCQSGWQTTLSRSRRLPGAQVMLGRSISPGRSGACPDNRHHNLGSITRVIGRHYLPYGALQRKARGRDSSCTAS